MESKSFPSQKFINNKEDVVSEAIDGLCLVNPHVKRIQGTQIVTLKTPRKGVNVICGGGSGHEPAHAGFVCDGILSAAVCGGVFASPSYQEVLTGIEQVANENGVLVIIKNYTGDVINFELASDLARSHGHKVMTLRVEDDIALGENETIGRRGLAGTVLLYKILGSAADELSLENLHSLGLQILKNVFTIGVSFSACSLPGYPPMYTLGQDEVEIGLGIHGEKGLQRIKTKSCDGLVDDLLVQFGKYVKSGDEVVVVVNNLGSCTDLEIMIIVRSLFKRLKSQGIVPIRAAVGRIMTSLEMHGMSITLYKVEKDIKQQVLKFLDLPCDCPHFKVVEPSAFEDITTPRKNAGEELVDTSKVIQLGPQGEKLKKIFKHIFENLVDKEAYFNQLDANVGDGDLGIGVSRASATILKILDYLPFEDNLVKTFKIIGELVAASFGGSSGPLYGIFLVRGSQKLAEKLADNKVENFANALKEGFAGISEVGRAKVGERTMLDVLDYVIRRAEELVKSGESDVLKVLTALAESARSGAEHASGLTAKRGRSVYLQGKEVGQKEPGCELVAEWLNLVKQGYEKQ